MNLVVESYGKDKWTSSEKTIQPVKHFLQCSKPYGVSATSMHICKDNYEIQTSG